MFTVEQPYQRARWVLVRRRWDCVSVAGGSGRPLTTPQGSGVQALRGLRVDILPALSSRGPRERLQSPGSSASSPGRASQPCPLGPHSSIRSGHPRGHGCCSCALGLVPVLAIPSSLWSPRLPGTLLGCTVLALGSSLRPGRGPRPRPGPETAGAFLLCTC